VKPANVRVAVLGAGLQGSCVALDLATSGIQVDLYDRNSQCMTQASLHNEGKIHLGYVYANDRSHRSAETMAEGAATFGPLLERWLGLQMSQMRRSTTFNYAVHRESMLSVSEVEAHMGRTHAHVAERIRPKAYLGIDIGKPPERLKQSELEADYDPSLIKAVYRTNEISIDPVALAMAVRDRVAADSLIHPMYETEVHGVSARGDTIGVEFTNGHGRSTVEYDQVVNALWDGRLAVDATLGLAPERTWLFRVKYYLKMRSTGARLPTTTIVLGPFGDVVDYGEGGYYLSWYPVGLQRASSDVRMDGWPHDLPGEVEAAVRSGIVQGLAAVMPGVAVLSSDDLEAAELAGGVIFAWGSTGIDDRNSELHTRYAIGPRTLGRYHSVDTGKLTTAPLYAHMVGERVRASR
jgi:glycine/D-amino acid oxidase-like deaminating enzyme